jgi:hypothetical protein
MAHMVLATTNMARKGHIWYRPQLTLQFKMHRSSSNAGAHILYVGSGDGLPYNKSTHLYMGPQGALMKSASSP